MKNIRINSKHFLRIAFVVAVCLLGIAVAMNWSHLYCCYMWADYKVPVAPPSASGVVSVPLGAKGVPSGETTINLEERYLFAHRVGWNNAFYDWTWQQRFKFDSFDECKEAMGDVEVAIQGHWDGYRAARSRILRTTTVSEDVESQ